MKAANPKHKEEEVTKKPFEDMVTIVHSNPSRTWTSEELYEVYKSKGGHNMSRMNFNSKIKETLKGDLHCLTSPGLPTTFLPKQNAASILKDLEKQQTNEDSQLSSISQQIKKDILNLPLISSHYPA